MMAKRLRSPAYPGINLKLAVNRATELYQQEHTHAAEPDVVLGHWKYAKGSYKVTLPPIDGSLNPVLRVQVGFAQSAPWSLLAPSSSKSASSSTATAYVWVHFFPDGGGTPLRWLRQISDDGALDLLTQDLSAYAGQTGTISVGVLSGSSSISKPVVFKELRVSYE